mmetsp:Transcript_26611/g.23588  ORF Transcript_26611/g.23588 Transcript_26611/m.23588 type:complete len:80 (+) Transcript_26611:537-776(+)
MESTFEYVNKTITNMTDVITENFLTYYEGVLYLGDNVIANHWEGKDMPYNIDYDTVGKNLSNIALIYQVIKDFGSENQR